jgi:hypothetical protein
MDSGFISILFGKGFSYVVKKIIFLALTLPTSLSQRAREE